MTGCDNYMFLPLLQGIVFSVRPPKKSWKNIANLSGGEKTLSSLSLVFALHHYKPTPLYVMDEIDAALGKLDLLAYQWLACLVGNASVLKDIAIALWQHNYVNLADLDICAADFEQQMHVMCTVATHPHP